MNTLPIPDALAHRPRHGGLPILFTVPYINGLPDFRLVDAIKVRSAMTRRLCGICGTKLGNWCVFVVSATQIREHDLAFVDAPSHEACVRYARTVCPYLGGTRARSARPLPPGARADYEAAPLLTEGFLGWTRTYRCEMDAKQPLAVVEHFHRVEAL